MGFIIIDFEVAKVHIFLVGQKGYAKIFLSFCDSFGDFALCCRDMHEIEPSGAS